MKGRQTDFRRSQCHVTAVSFVEHPVRQLTTKVGPLVCVDTFQVLTTAERRYLKHAIK